MLKTEEELIEAFHMLWDNFPGPVRLINRNHMVVAANPLAMEKGFVVGCCCARVGEPSSHKGCKAADMIKTGCAKQDRPDSDRIRGWIPLLDHTELYVHYTMMIPKES